MNGILDKVKNYLENKENKSKEELDLLNEINDELNYIVISSISLDDIKSAGYDVSNATNNDLRVVANKMCDYYNQSMFQEDLYTALDVLDLPNIKKII